MQSFYTGLKKRKLLFLTQFLLFVFYLFIKINNLYTYHNIFLMYPQTHLRSFELIKRVFELINTALLLYMMSTIRYLSLSRC